MKKKVKKTEIEPDGYTIGFLRKGTTFFDITDGMYEIPLELCTAYVEGCNKNELTKLNEGFIPSEDILDAWGKENKVKIIKS